MWTGGNASRVKNDTDLAHASLKKHVHFPLHCSPYSLSLPCSPSSEAGGRSPGDDHLIISDLPDVCQTIEVVTENEEQAVTSSDLYPLQISPVSSYGGWLDKYTLNIYLRYLLVFEF